MINIGQEIFNLILIPSHFATMDTILMFTVQCSVIVICLFGLRVSMIIVQPPKWNVQMTTAAKGCSIYHQQQNKKAIETEVNAQDMLIYNKTRLMNDFVLV